MAAFWVITTLENQVQNIGSVSSSKQVLGQTPIAEGVGVLNLIKDINNKTKHIELGEIVVYIDIKKIVKEVTRKFEKES